MSNTVYVVVRTLYKDLENLSLELVDRKVEAVYGDFFAACDAIAQAQDFVSTSEDAKCVSRCWQEDDGTRMYETLWVQETDFHAAVGDLYNRKGKEATMAAYKATRGYSQGFIGPREWLLIAYKNVELDAIDISKISGIPKSRVDGILRLQRITPIKGRSDVVDIKHLLMFLDGRYDTQLRKYCGRVLAGKATAVGIVPTTAKTTAVPDLPKLGIEMPPGAWALYDPVLRTVTDANAPEPMLIKATALAVALDISTAAFKYWEKQGWLEPQERDQYGARVYNERDIARFLNTSHGAKYRAKWNAYIWRAVKEGTK